jgi:hypothetical protein
LAAPGQGRTTIGHDTTTLFAARNILDGTIIIGCNMKRHRHQEFLRFLNIVEAQVLARKGDPHHHR